MQIENERNTQFLQAKNNRKRAEQIKDELKEGKLKTFTMPELVFKRQFNIVYHKNKFIPPEMQEVIDECLQLSSNK